MVVMEPIISRPRTLSSAKFCNTPSLWLHHDSRFFDIMTVLVHCAGVLDLENKVKFVDAHMKYIVYYTPSTDYLPTRTRASFVQIIWFAKLCITDNYLLLLLERLSTETGTVKYLCVLNPNCSVLPSSEPDEIELVVGSNGYSIKMFTQSTPSQAPSFNYVPDLYACRAAQGLRRSVCY